MIIVTGGAGFIGSALIYELNKIGRKDILVVDDLESTDKWKNLKGLKFDEIVGIEDFLMTEFFEEPEGIDAVFHMGACSATTEKDVDYLLSNNVEYSKRIYIQCAMFDIPLFYASSAATYGSGEYGYNDNEAEIPKLRPLNPYGYSKQLFDEWVLKAPKAPSTFAGLKFFNVFGPNEYHKESMTSVVFKAFEQIKEKGSVKLFKSHKDEFLDGEQKRDFIYVKDVAKAMLELWKVSEDKNVQGIFNLGTGQARTFKDLVAATFKALSLETNIEFIDMPSSLRNQYQYFTEANMTKFEKLLPSFKFHSLEDGVKDYINNHLDTLNPYLDIVGQNEV